jgi:ubiquinone/menaquinone biosynthesis C-methylase UbiE
MMFRKAQQEGFGRKDFEPVATNGMGDPYNAYAHSMAWFQDRLYVGTARANLHLIRRRNPPPQWAFYPVNAPDDPFKALDLRAQIWRYHPGRREWRNTHKAPLVKGREGGKVPREIGIRGMAVFQGPSDAAPALYVGTFSPTRGPGPMILRSEDGDSFRPVSKPGFGHDGISAFRSLVPFKEKLYTSPVGATGNRPNVSTVPVIFESDDPASGKWRVVSEPGFGNPHNTAIFEMAVFNDHLYAGTFNAVSGFEIWKTEAEGRTPYRWKPVIRSGAYRGNLNEGALSLCVFGDALYVGTGIQDGGYDRANRLGPAAGEVIRIYPDDTWNIVVGDSRRPPWRPSAPLVSLSGRSSGFGNFFNGYIWRMCAHDGALYVGTFDWSGFLPYSPLDRWPEQVREKVLKIGVQNIVDQQGGCDLWSTRDGIKWSPITRTGFGNQYNCGARTMVSTPEGLFVGTANPFGPEVAVQTSQGWKYEPNPRGGTEIWLGSSSQDDDETRSQPRGDGPRPVSEALEIRTRSDAREERTERSRPDSVINEKYNREMYGEVVNDYYGYSDFHNFGYWLPETRNQREASENLLEKLLAFIPRRKGSILDVACGKGATTRHLLRYYEAESVTGINISSRQLETCRVNAPRCRFRLMDATSLRFPRASFDNVICVEAAFHFNTREDFLREALRVLKPGGRLVLSDILSTRLWERTVPQRHEENYVGSLKEYRAIFERAGFQRVRIVESTRESWEGFAEHYSQFLLRKLRRKAIKLETFLQQMALIKLTRQHLRHYLLVSAQKPPDGLRFKPSSR